MDNTAIMCWNAHGLNARAHRDSVRTLVRDERPHIACIIETKLQTVAPMLVLSMLGMNFVDYVYLPAAGTCGGVLIAAKEPDIRLSDVHVGCFSMTILVHVGDATPWWLTVVYGP